MTELLFSYFVEVTIPSLDSLVFTFFKRNNYLCKEKFMFTSNFIYILNEQYYKKSTKYEFYKLACYITKYEFPVQNQSLHILQFVSVFSLSSLALRLASLPLLVLLAPLESASNCPKS